MLNILIWTWCIAAAAKLVGVPIMKEVPWMYFLVIPIIALVLRLIFKVLELIGSVLLLAFSLDFMVWMYNHWLSTGPKAGTYETLFHKMLMGIWHGIVWMFTSGWEWVTGLF